MKKEEQIRMLLHPEDYTDEQLDQMLDETDVKVPDADEAWEKFRGESKRSKRLPLLKVAAMFIGVLMLSGIAYAAVHIIRNHEVGVKSQETVVSTNTQHLSPNTQTPTDSTAMKPIVYEDAELATILNEIATFYQCEVVYKSEASKQIRLYFTWDKKVTIDELIDTFNKFERIHITRDNKKLIVE
jgi:cytoskeletal protein RodZ